MVSPKRCGHTKGKMIVSRDEACIRIKAACDARDENNLDIVILARTDALHLLGFEEAMWRMKEFKRLGADMLFLEAIQTKEQMLEFCKSIEGPKMMNNIEEGLSPFLSQQELGEIGYTVVAYPISLMSSSINAMKKSLQVIKDGGITKEMLNVDKNPIMPFQEVKRIVGFQNYYEEEEKYQYTKNNKTT